MAKYELPIYGENDEIIKEYTSNICPWAVYIEAAEMQETLKDKSAREQMDAVGKILKAVFDGGDVLNTFMQIVQGGQNIKGGNKSKNA